MAPAFAINRTGRRSSKDDVSGGSMRVTRRAAGRASLAAGVLCVAAVGSAAEPITLRLHTFNSPKAIVNELFLEPWAREIAASSDGRVTIQVFPAMQLGGRPADLYGQARDGVVDLAWTLPGYSPGRFPLTEVFELPFVCSDAVATSQALTTFHRKWMRHEYRDTHPLVFHATAPGQIHTVDDQVRTLADMKGLEVRAASQTVAAMLEALGAVPVGMPVPQVYEALARGVVEGAMVPWTIMRPFRLHEVTRHHTEVGLGCTPFVLAMNRARYEGLPDDVRQLLDDSTGMALARRLGRIWQEDEEAGREIARHRGHPIVPLPDVERARWRAATAPVVDAWVQKVDAMGYDGRALLADARRLIARYADASTP
ncbi:MAG: TRAP transporter substrate-binding protein [Chloroflexi bacterium]|nr:TRAP transporter substrate-binding protein [Chloroflexota bacterium]